MKKKITAKFSTTQLILSSFLIAILLGSILLSLPISWAEGKEISYIDALFTATTSVCVTGLVTLPTVSSWSWFGHLIIIILIQIGGLGVITIMSGIMISLHKKMGIGEHFLIMDAFNLNSLSGLSVFVKKVLLGTLVVEGIGALCYMIVFIPEFGLKGIWISIFTAISAFCNAGIDIIAENSLCNYALNPIINLVTSLLIILGGLGFVVWWDVLRVLRNFKYQKFRCFNNLTLHSKLVLYFTSILIAGGAILIFIFELNNPLTLKNLSLFDQIQVALFQSITTRTAGFATIPQEYLTNASSFICLLLMFIGGSPAGTAGGIKTVTALVLIHSAFSMIQNKNETVLFDRHISRQAINKAISVTFMSFTIAFISTVLLSFVSQANALDIMFETVSATATVGLTRNLTSYLNIWGKIIIICTMYLGRVGPISLAVLFNTRKVKQNIIKNPTEEIIVG